MLEDLLRLAGTFALGAGFVCFWYYVISRTGSF